MSSILKGDILNVGQLEELIFNAINFLGCTGNVTQPVDPCDAQREFARRLANAISQGVATGVQNYLNQTVKTINQDTLEGSGGQDNLHVHPNVAQYSLTAP